MYFIKLCQLQTQKKKDDLEAVHTKYCHKKDVLTSQLKAVHDERDKLQAEIDHTSKTFTAEKADLEKQIATLKPEEKQVTAFSKSTYTVEVIELYYVIQCFMENKCDISHEMIFEFLIKWTVNFFARKTFW